MTSKKVDPQSLFDTQAKSEPCPDLEEERQKDAMMPLVTRSQFDSVALDTKLQLEASRSLKKKTVAVMKQKEDPLKAHVYSLAAETIINEDSKATPLAATVVGMDAEDGNKDVVDGLLDGVHQEQLELQLMKEILSVIQPSAGAAAGEGLMVDNLLSDARRRLWKKAELELTNPSNPITTTNTTNTKIQAAPLTSKEKTLLKGLYDYLVTSGTRDLDDLLDVMFSEVFQFFNDDYTPDIKRIVDWID